MAFAWLEKLCGIPQLDEPICEECCRLMATTDRMASHYGLTMAILLSYMARIKKTKDIEDTRKLFDHAVIHAKGLQEEMNEIYRGETQTKQSVMSETQNMEDTNEHTE